MASVKVFEKGNTPVIVINSINVNNFNATIVEALKTYTFCRTKQVPNKKLKELQQAFLECVNHNKANRYFSPTDEENVYQFDDMKIEFEIFNDAPLHENYNCDDELDW